jgi:hypothetical protein
MTPQGYLALVLHAHLPFVRHPEYDDFLEEDWFYEAITETYIPLVNMMDGLLNDGCDFRLTMSITPPLAAMLGDQLLQDRYVRTSTSRSSWPTRKSTAPRATTSSTNSPGSTCTGWKIAATFSSTSIIATCSPPSANSRTRASSKSSPAARRTVTCR